MTTEEFIFDCPKCKGSLMVYLADEITDKSNVKSCNHCAHTVTANEIAQEMATHLLNLRAEQAGIKADKKKSRL